MYKLALRDFVLGHENWEELLSRAPYNLKISYDGDYVMFKYNQIASDFSIPLVREARGIIFHKDTWECVCHAFNKFGNMGEAYVPELDWASAYVTEKIDGSLLKIFYDCGEWRIATNGTIDAFKANLNNALYQTFGDLFMVAIELKGLAANEFFGALDTRHTYMFELVSPYNQVVIPYSKPDLYFLGSRDMETGVERPMSQNPLKGVVECPKSFKMGSMADVEALAKTLPWDEEGYVCVDEHFNRCKIKSPAYVRAHYARNNSVITVSRLVDVILNNEVEEFCIYCPEYLDTIRGIVQKMNRVADTAKEFAGAVEGIRDKKELALSIAHIPKVFQGFLFKRFKDGTSWEEYVCGWKANKWENVINDYEIKC